MSQSHWCPCFPHDIILCTKEHWWWCITPEESLYRKLNYWCLVFKPFWDYIVSLCFWLHFRNAAPCFCFFRPAAPRTLWIMCLKKCSSNVLYLGFGLCFIYFKITDTHSESFTASTVNAWPYLCNGNYISVHATINKIAWWTWLEKGISCNFSVNMRKIRYVS